MSISVSEKKIKSKIKLGERIAVIENIKYPCFESRKYEKLCKKMNDFYSSVAEKYSHHARNKLPRKMKAFTGTRSCPALVGMSYTLALCDDRIISVVLDITFSRGENVKTRRFSQMWSTQSGDILPVCEVVKTDRETKKKIYSLVANEAKENAENPSFGYFDNYLSGLSRSFDIRNCFAVPKGICFFINAGILSPLKYGCGSFVMTYGKLKGLLGKEFETKNDENTLQNTNIVNNI